MRGLFKKRMLLLVDQYGCMYRADSVESLAREVSGGASPRVSRMLRRTPNGVEHVGYVVGDRWCRAYLPVSVPA